MCTPASTKMPITVLVNVDGTWQPQQLAGTEQDPIPADVEHFKEWVAHRVLGPAEARSKVLNEQQSDVPSLDGGKGRDILVQQRVELARVDVYAQPSEWAAPCWKEACKQAVAAGVNIEHMLSGSEAASEQLLGSQEQLNNVMSAAAAQQQQLQAATMALLTAKLLNEAESKALHTALLAEGAAGMWEMLSDSTIIRNTGITGASLRGLMAALGKPVLSAEVQLPAACAVWHLCMMTKPRERLVQLGVVEALLHIVDSTFHKLGKSSHSSADTTTINNSSTSCSTSGYLALLTASLGTLAVLAVDRSAREHLLASRLGLALLADVAGQDPDHWLAHADKQQVGGLCMFTQEEEQHEEQTQGNQAVGVPAGDALEHSNNKAAAAASVGHVQQPAAPPAAAESLSDDTPINHNSSTGAVDDSSAEGVIKVPVALLEVRPNQMAAEVLATVLLRDAAARVLFLQQGSLHLLLQLLKAPDVRVQLCGVAAVARMACTPSGSDHQGQLAAQEPQLLRQVHSSIFNLLTNQAQRQQQQQLQQQQQCKQELSELHNKSLQDDRATACDSAALGTSATSTLEEDTKACASSQTNPLPDNGLEEMLLEYTSLALWVITAAVAPLYTKDEVLQHLADAGKLADQCMTVKCAAATTHSVLCCLAGMVCAIAATPAAAQAAADLPDSSRAKPGDSKATALIHALQPALASLLAIESATPEAVHAKFLSAVTVMLLASFEHPPGVEPAASQGANQHSFTNISSSAVAPEQQQQGAVNQHPPFRGVFREAINAVGLLPAILALVMHGKDAQQRHYRSSCFDEDDRNLGQQASARATCIAGGMMEQVTGGLEQQATDLNSTKTLLVQVVAAACQMLVAVNQPLPPARCAEVLDFLWNQATHQSAQDATGHHTSRLSSSEGHHTSTPATIGSVVDTGGLQDSRMLSDGGQTTCSKVTASTPLYAATIWCLAQHPQQQQQMIMDGRWAQLLELLMKPGVQRIKRAIPACGRSCPVTDDAPFTPISGTGANVNVPRLQLQRVQAVQSSTSSARSPLCTADGVLATAAAGTGFSNGGGSTLPTSKRVIEAVRICHLCLQSCWLVLQQEANMRQVAAEWPQNLKAVYAKGKSSWWALELDQPTPAKLSEADNLGLLLMVDSLSLPDNWTACLQLKALALNSCWCLAHADQAMNEQLIQLGVPQLTSARCQHASGTICCFSQCGAGATDHAKAELRLQVAAAGYLTTAVQHAAAVESLGGPENVALLLASLLDACIRSSTPSDVNTIFLGRLLQALAWLSAKKEAAGACCKPKVVSALLDVLRLEKQAYKELQTLVAAQYSAQSQQEQQHQQQRQQSPTGLPPTWANCDSCSLSSAHRPALAASAALQPLSEPGKLEVPSLPMAAIQAPFAAMQRPETWLPAWLQQHSKRQHPQATFSYSCCSSPQPMSLNPSCWRSNSTAGRSPSACREHAPNSSRIPGSGRYQSSHTPSAPSLGIPAAAATCSSSSRPQSPGAHMYDSKGSSASNRACNSTDGDQDQFATSSGQMQSSTDAPDGSEGMLAVWALLNISVHHDGKIMVCKKGLYTLLRLVQHCPDVQRVSVVATVLQNLTTAVENTGMIYKAELRLKHAALLKQAGLKRVNRDRHVSSRPGHSDLHTAAAAGTGSDACASKQQLLRQLQAQAVAATSSAGSATASASVGLYETCTTPPRTTRLSLAADTACLVANMCNTGRGPPKKLSHEDEKAGAILSRVSILTARHVVQVHRPDKPEGSPQLTARPGNAAAFSDGVKALLPSAASITAAAAASREQSPRNSAMCSSTGGTAATGTTAAAGQAVAGVQPQVVRAAFLKWLQEQMPDAAGAEDTAASAGSTPRASVVAPARPGQQGCLPVQEEVLQGLTSMAELGSTTTEDMEESEWLEQQREAQKVHDFFAARAAQGNLLRGSLANSLRSSRATLWDAKVQEGCNKQQLRQQQGIPARPMSAPGRSRSSSPSCSARSIGQQGSMGTTNCSSPKSATMASSRPTSRAGQRPNSSTQDSPLPRSPCTPAAARPLSPSRCCSPIVGASISRPSSAGGRLPSSRNGKSNHAITSSAGKGTAPGGPWAPAVVEYRQQAAAVNKSWQMQSQLLVAAAEEHVVQELAAAATELLSGHLPTHSPPSLLRSSMQRKAALELQMEHLQLTEDLTEAASAQLSPITAVVQPLIDLNGTGEEEAQHVQQQLDEQQLQQQPDMPECQQQEQGTLQQQQQPPQDNTCDGSAPAEHSPQARVTWRETADSCGAASALPSHPFPGLTVDCTITADDACSSNLDEDADATLLLQRPNTAYAIPNVGTLFGKQYIPELRGIFSTAVADSVIRNQQNLTMRSLADAAKAMLATTPPGCRAAASDAERPSLDVPDRVPRPVTVVEVSEEMGAKPLQVLARGRPDSTSPDRLFDFHSLGPPEDPALTMHVFEHCDGAQFCNDLFGHYLLPNGKLAHIYLPAGALRQGHVVTIHPPPATPWDVDEWLPPAGLPVAPAAETFAGLMQPGQAAALLPMLKALNWVPVPQLPPQPATCTLHATRDSAGSLQLKAGLPRFKAVVRFDLESREYRKPKPVQVKKRPTSLMAGAAPQLKQQQAVQQPAAATGPSASAGRPLSAVSRSSQQQGPRSGSSGPSTSGLR